MYYTLAVYIDLRNAFDTVHHRKLIAKLHNLNQSSDQITLFKSYLSESAQQTYANNKLYNKASVPQGSMLGTRPLEHPAYK